MGNGLNLRQLFANGGVTFASSPLYQELCSVVADNEFLLGLAAKCRPGQRPPNLLFAAVHLLVKEEPFDELAWWYASIVGPELVRDPSKVGPVFVDFCRVHEAQLTKVLESRLVQTNVVKRAAALRIGLARIACQIAGPVALVEVGCSAGALLSQHGFRYRADGQEWGRPDSPVKIDFEWRSDLPIPDLDKVPAIGRRIGIDLYAIDPADPDDRKWMQALVWPENQHEADLLNAALQVVADDPPRRLIGDASRCVEPAIRELSADLPVVIFHAATRAHVPPADRPGYDAAITRISETRDLFHLSLEGSAEEWFYPFRGSFLLQLEEAGPSRPANRQDLAIVEQHGEWILPLDANP